MLVRVLPCLLIFLVLHSACGSSGILAETSTAVPISTSQPVISQRAAISIAIEEGSRTQFALTTEPENIRAELFTAAEASQNYKLADLLTGSHIAYDALVWVVQYDATFVRRLDWGPLPESTAIIPSQNSVTTLASPIPRKATQLMVIDATTGGMLLLTGR